MIVERIRDIESLEKIGDMWKQLLFSSGQDCIFFTHEWISSWWKCFSGERMLEILIFKDERENPIGIAPFMIQDECLCFIASQEVSDYSDVITIEKRRVEFYEILLKYIRENYSGLKKIELTNIRYSSPTLKFLPQLAPRHKYSCSLTETQVAPLLELPSSYEDYMRSLNKKNRHEIRRKLRRVESLDGVTIKKITDTQELMSAIDAFIAFHRKSSPLKEKFWRTKGMADFFREMTYRFSFQNWIELIFLYQEDKTMAALLNFIYSNQIYFYNVAYSKDFARFSPGIYLFNHSIENAISEKKEKADFLRGREEYKYYFGAKDSKIFCLNLTPQEC
ncbi:MAG: GNAT family N-acetyltransferase [Candidatus Aminicenantes bacterium]|nr:MAG: GNAT family N-acetyltransferase [Candidatus Aminicenantes bacterium]